MKDLRDYVATLARSFREARRLDSFEGRQAELPAAEPAAGGVLLLSPHPDDECLTGALPLRLRREARMRVVNLPVTLGSHVGRRERRLAELERATAHLGFDLRFDERLVEGDRQQTVERIARAVAELEPVAIFLPHDRDGHPTHVRTHRLAIEALGRLPELSCAIFETEYWQAMSEPRPNLLVASSVDDVGDLVTAVSLHRGEVERAPYHLWLPAWLMDNARRAELLTGMGGGQPELLFGTYYRLRQWSDGELSAPSLEGLRVVPEDAAAAELVGLAARG